MAVWLVGKAGSRSVPERVTVEIKVGITHVNREVVVESDKSAEDISKDLAKAIADGGVLTLVDDKGRKVLIPATGIAYVDLGSEHVRPVGFGTV